MSSGYQFAYRPISSVAKTLSDDVLVNVLKNNLFYISTEDYDCTKKSMFVGTFDQNSSHLELGEDADVNTDNLVADLVSLQTMFRTCYALILFFKVDFVVITLGNLEVAKFTNSDAPATGTYAWLNLQAFWRELFYASKCYPQMDYCASVIECVFLVCFCTLLCHIIMFLFAFRDSLVS